MKEIFKKLLLISLSIFVTTVFANQHSLNHMQLAASPPGLQGKSPQGLKGKTPHGWNYGKKKGWYKTRGVKKGKKVKLRPVVPVPNVLD